MTDSFNNRSRSCLLQNINTARWRTDRRNRRILECSLPLRHRSNMAHSGLSYHQEDALRYVSTCSPSEFFPQTTIHYSQRKWFAVCSRTIFPPSRWHFPVGGLYSKLRRTSVLRILQDFSNPILRLRKGSKKSWLVSGTHPSTERTSYARYPPQS